MISSSYRPILLAGLVLATLAPVAADAQRYDPRASDPLAQQGDPYRERVEVRLNAMENELRELTGRVEDMGYNVRRLQDRLDKLVGDVDFRLTAIERALREGGAAGVPPAGASGGTAAGGPAAGGGTGAAPAASGGSDLGSISTGSGGSTAGGSRPTQPSANVTLPSGSAMDQYAYAQQLMSQTRYPEAESAFQQFIQRHPEGQLTDNARYWLGETFYVRRNYAEAATTFLDAYQKAPAGSKAPDNLLKLGLSLSALQKKQEACVALDKLLRDHPNADSRLRQRADQERSQIACG